MGSVKTGGRTKNFPPCTICGKATSTSTAKVCKICGIKIRKFRSKSLKTDDLIEIYLDKKQKERNDE